MARRYHQPQNGFTMCLAARWPQPTRVSESWNEAGHCCAAAEKDPQNPTGRKPGNKGDEVDKGRSCVSVRGGAASRLPAVRRTGAVAATSRKVLRAPRQGRNCVAGFFGGENGKRSHTFPLLQEECNDRLVNLQAAGRMSFSNTVSRKHLVKKEANRCHDWRR